MDTKTTCVDENTIWPFKAWISYIIWTAVKTVWVNLLLHSQKFSCISHYLLPVLYLVSIYTVWTHLQHLNGQLCEPKVWKVDIRSPANAQWCSSISAHLILSSLSFVSSIDWARTAWFPTHRPVLLTRLSIVLNRETKDGIDQSGANTISWLCLIILRLPSAHRFLSSYQLFSGSTWHFIIDLQWPALRIRRELDYSDQLTSYIIVIFYMNFMLCNWKKNVFCDGLMLSAQILLNVWPIVWKCLV